MSDDIQVVKSRSMARRITLSGGQAIAIHDLANKIASALFVEDLIDTPYDSDKAEVIIEVVLAELR